jgi:hypothetical protein
MGQTVKIKADLIFKCLLLSLMALIFQLGVSTAQNLMPLEGPGSGLVGWWKFDEGGGLYVADSSGNGNTGVIMGNPTWVTSPISGQAMKQNGLTDYVRIAPSSSLSLGVFSIGMWVNITDMLRTSSSFFAWGRNGCYDRYRMFYIPSGAIQATYQNYASHNFTSTGTIAGAGTVKIGEWAHYVFVYDGAAANPGVVSLTVYKNGASVGSYTNTNGLDNCGSMEAIGSHFDPPAPAYQRTFAGYVDDVRAYNRALTPSDVLTLYDATRPRSTDVTAPSVPTGLTANNVGSDQINLSWNASTDNVGVAGYIIYRAGTAIDSVQSGTTYSDKNHGLASTFTYTVAPSTSYTYTVAAYDAANNVSAQSSSASDTTGAYVNTGPYTLAVTKAGVSAKTVGSAPGSINCGGSCSDSYPSRTVVLLTPDYAYADTGGVPPAFSNWSGAGCSGNGECYILMDGNKSVTANYSSSSTDTTPPAVTAFSIPAAANNLTVSISTFTATDNVAVTGYMLTESSPAPLATDSGWTTTAPTSRTFSSAGSKALYAWAKDAAGNVSTSRSASVVIDLTVPAVAAFTIPATSTTLIVPVTTFTASDNIGVTGYILTETSTTPLITDSRWATTVPASYTFSSTGSKTLYAWVRDAAGNISTSRSASVVISGSTPDTTLPTVTAFVIPARSNSLVVPVTTFTATDNIGVAAHILTESSSTPALTDSRWTPTVPASYTFSSSGSKTLYARVKDAAGNISASRSDSVFIDLALPSISTFSIPATSTSLIVPVTSFTAMDNVGVTGYILTESGTRPLLSNPRWTVAAPASYSFSSAGSKTLYAWVRDAAGNISTGRSAIITINTTGPTTISFQLSSGGAVSADTPGTDVTAQAGYASLSVNSGNNPYGTAVFSLEQNGVIVTEAGVPASPPTLQARIFIDYREGVNAVPGRTGAGTVNTNTGIAVVNNGTLAATITYTLRDRNGLPVTSGSGTLAAGHHFARFIDKLYEYASGFSVPANFQTAIQFGTLDIQSTQAVSMLALRGTSNQRDEFLMTTTPVADLSQSLSYDSIYFPQFADGGGYTTSIILLNTSTSVETGVIEIRGETGSPFSVSMVGGSTGYSFPYTIPAGGVARYQTDGSPSTAGAGWARVAPDSGSPTPVGSGIFGYNPGSVLYSESGVPATVPTKHARIYVDLSRSHNTGLAIANAGSSSASIAINAYYDDGNTLAGTSQGPLSLAGNGYRAQFADGFIADLPAGFTGILDIISDTDFAALTLRSLTNERNEFLMTTFPVADANRVPPAPVIFPQVVDGGGYMTEFILISATGSSNATLSIYDENGAPFVW